MTLTELKSLTGSQLRILVAEAEGWSGFSEYVLHPAFGEDLCADHYPGCTQFAPKYVPRFDTNRDTITEAILRRFADEEWQERFIEALVKIIAPEAPLPSCLTLVGLFCIATASAEDLCRVFILVLKGEK